MFTVINDDALLKKGFTISTDQDLLDLNVIHSYLCNESYWSKGITKDKVQRSIENSMCFGVYKDGKQVGLARVITDKAIFAYLCDVFILNEHRGNGLSKWLLQTILAHPELQGLKRWTLSTLDAHGLYKQFGFIPLSNPDNWMNIFTSIKND